MIEIKQECHCENPALEKAKEKGYELVCPDCWRWVKRKPLYPELPSPSEREEDL